MTRVAVLTLDSLRAKMAGPAIRAWEMCGALAAAGHEVRLESFGGVDLEHRGGGDFLVEAVTVPDIAAVAVWADVLVVQGVLLLGVPALRETDTVIVADLYDPFHLESLEVERYAPTDQRWQRLEVNIGEIRAQLDRADLFLCASDKQRDFWLGHLALAGRINPATYDDDPDLHDLVAVVPFGLSPTPPEPSPGALRDSVDGIGPDDTVVLWGGGVYNWFDPLTLVRAVDRARHEVPGLRLYFLGMKHPNPDVPSMQVAARTQELADELGLTGSHVFFNYDWVDYDKRGAYLLDADLGVSCHYQHVETAFSFRTRILDYLWAGLPIVATDGDTFAPIIRDRGVGRVVPAEDVDALAAALVDLASDPDARAACAAAAREVARGFTWPVALAPLLEFCAAPRRARDHERIDARVADVHRQAMRFQAARDLRVAVAHLREGGLPRLRAAVRSRAATLRGR